MGFLDFFKKAQVAPSIVVLRDVSDADGTRRLHASLTAKGDVGIEGRDYGDGVERIFGYREYEWVWTIPAASVPALLAALGAQGDVLAALQKRFSGNNAADLAAFLEENKIEVAHWSRIGD